jgi:hypothetical protein
VAAFETADIAVMTSQQVDAMILASPIVLDLSGHGIQTTSAANGVHFDLMGTGNTSQKVGWTGDGTALLVRDRNGDGVINDGTELYGSATQNALGQRMGNGYAALGLEDTNHDGKINAKDAHFSDMKLWVDANHNGKTDAGELHGLVEMGVVEINLDFTKTSTVNNGNFVGMVSSFTKADGTQGQAADVWFAKDQPAHTPSAADLLAAPQGELLGSGGAHAAPVASGTMHISPVVAAQLRGILDDDPRHQTPLI